MNTADIRNAVLKVRAAKGMLEDAYRYASPAMQGTKKTNLVDVALESQSKQNGDDGPDFNRHSCGSFFMNPILTPQQAETLPEDAPRFDAALPGGGQGVKTSAAWLIDHAGFHKGFKINEKRSGWPVHAAYVGVDQSWGSISRRYRPPRQNRAGRRRGRVRHPTGARAGRHRHES